MGRLYLGAWLSDRQAPGQGCQKQIAFFRCDPPHLSIPVAASCCATALAAAHKRPGWSWFPLGIPPRTQNRNRLARTTRGSLHRYPGRRTAARAGPDRRRRTACRAVAAGVDGQTCLWGQGHALRAFGAEVAITDQLFGEEDIRGVTVYDRFGLFGCCSAKPGSLGVTCRLWHPAGDQGLADGGIRLTVLSGIGHPRRRSVIDRTRPDLEHAGKTVQSDRRCRTAHRMFQTVAAISAREA